MRSFDASWIRLRSMSTAAVVPNRLAIRLSVSPRTTLYVATLGLAAGGALGAGAADRVPEPEGTMVVIGAALARGNALRLGGAPIEGPWDPTAPGTPLELPPAPENRTAKNTTNAAAIKTTKEPWARCGRPAKIRGRAGKWPWSSRSGTVRTVVRVAMADPVAPIRPLALAIDRSWATR